MPNSQNSNDKKDQQTTNNTNKNNLEDKISLTNTFKDIFENSGDVESEQSRYEDFKQSWTDLVGQKVTLKTLKSERERILNNFKKKQNFDDNKNFDNDKNGKQNVDDVTKDKNVVREALATKVWKRLSNWYSANEEKRKRRNEKKIEKEEKEFTIDLNVDENDFED